jgi:hypothetical protein
VHDISQPCNSGRRSDKLLFRRNDDAICSLSSRAAHGSSLHLVKGRSICLESRGIYIRRIVVILGR